MWPLNGSCWNMKSKAALSFSSGIFQATNAPSARLLATRVWRNAPDGAGSEHGLEALQHGVDGDAAVLGDGEERFTDEALDLVLGDGEDLGVEGVGVFDAGHGKWGI